MSQAQFYLITGTLSALLSLYSFSSYYVSTGEGLLDASDAIKMIKEGKIKNVIDVRTKMEYDMGHYKDAIHIASQTFSKEKFKMFNKNEPVLVYCNTGHRAKMASQRMRNEFGFKDVYYIATSHLSLKN